ASLGGLPCATTRVAWPPSTMTRRPLTSPLFPYTTLFRSPWARLACGVRRPLRRPGESRPQGQREERHAQKGHAMNGLPEALAVIDRKSTRLNSSHVKISYAVFCLKKKTRPVQTLAEPPPS